ncbi:hypothetical protein Fot_37339 [Forsythia ovata]|uniref:Uncharacterized protein n=1 Tax=Forsythia ovata TaxID=205694 RepID=A0ABD1S127_9LAMI
MDGIRRCCAYIYPHNFSLLPFIYFFFLELQNSTAFINGQLLLLQIPVFKIAGSEGNDGKVTLHPQLPISSTASVPVATVPLVPEAAIDVKEKEIVTDEGEKLVQKRDVRNEGNVIDSRKTKRGQVTPPSPETGESTQSPRGTMWTSTLAPYGWTKRINIRSLGMS